MSAGNEARDETEQLIESLTNLPGTSSFESSVRDKIIELWKENSGSITVDRVGNVVAEMKPGDPDKDRLTVLIMAHMDEAGFIVTKVDEKGFIRARPLGGWIDHVLWAHLWHITVGDRTIEAVTGMDAPHVLTNFDTPPEVKSSHLFFDTGLSRERLLELGVRPGLPITPAANFRVLDPGKRYAAKALDDRAPLAMMTELLDEIKRNPEPYRDLKVVFAATVQEEVGMRGATALAGDVDPDVILNAEMGIAKDYPTQFATQTSPELGKGPALFAYDGSMLPSPRLVDFIYQLARRENIPTQWESEDQYSQDASSLQLSGRGVHAINIGLPTRYGHSHWGIMDRQDYDLMLQLLMATLRELSAEAL